MIFILVQVQENKYYIPANYYYGFISYYDKDFTEALRAFKLVEIYEEYKGVVPYYITEIYYFQGNKDEALSYGQAVLQKYPNIYYADRLRLLMGQPKEPLKALINSATKKTPWVKTACTFWVAFI